MGKRILLADDSVTIQKVVELTFLDEDFEVVAVSNGDEAVARLEEVRPELVIADVHMPGANGYEVCERVKQWRPGTPVVLLVGTFEPFDEGRARAAGADYHLKKPFDSQELLHQVEVLLAAAGDQAVQVIPAEEMEPWQGAAEPEPPESADAQIFAGGGEAEPEPVGPLGGQALPEELVLEASPWTEAEEGAGGGWARVAEEPAAPAPAPPPPPAAPAAPAPWAGVESAGAAPPEAGAGLAANGGLTAEQVERIARRVVELIGERLVREVAWEVIPDMAEMVIKDRLRELERQLEGP
jgi:CheY-like chemotaxis protein